MSGEALKVSLRDDDSDSESNTWMAEDAIWRILEATLMKIKEHTYCR